MPASDHVALVTNVVPQPLVGLVCHIFQSHRDIDDGVDQDVEGYLSALSRDGELWKLLYPQGQQHYSQPSSQLFRDFRFKQSDLQYSKRPLLPKALALEFDFLHRASRPTPPFRPQLFLEPHHLPNRRSPSRHVAL